MSDGSSPSEAKLGHGHQSSRHRNYQPPRPVVDLIEGSLIPLTSKTWMQPLGSALRR